MARRMAPVMTRVVACGVAHRAQDQRFEFRPAALADGALSALASSFRRGERVGDGGTGGAFLPRAERCRGRNTRALPRLLQRVQPAGAFPRTTFRA